MVRMTERACDSDLFGGRRKAERAREASGAGMAFEGELGDGRIYFMGELGDACCGSDLWE